MVFVMLSYKYYFFYLIFIIAVLIDTPSDDTAKLTLLFVKSPCELVFLVLQTLQVLLYVLHLSFYGEELFLQLHCVMMCSLDSVDEVTINDTSSSELC